MCARNSLRLRLRARVETLEGQVWVNFLWKLSGLRVGIHYDLLSLKVFEGHWLGYHLLVLLLLLTNQKVRGRAHWSCHSATIDLLEGIQWLLNTNSSICRHDLENVGGRHEFWRRLLKSGGYCHGLSLSLGILVLAIPHLTVRERATLFHIIE